MISAAISRFRARRNLLRPALVAAVWALAALPAVALTPQTITGSITTTGNIYAFQQVNFSAAGSNTGYTWNPAIGTPSYNSPTAATSFSTPGNFSVTVQAPATATYAASNLVTLTGTVQLPQTQVITASPPSQITYVGQTVYFSANGSNTTYNWTSSSGTPTATGGSAKISWAAPGNQTVTVQAPASGGRYSASNAVTMTIAVLSKTPQVITATPSTQTTFTGQTVYFTASGGNTTYLWNGVGGSASTSMSWSSPGTYTVQVQAAASTLNGAYTASNVVTLTINVLLPQTQSITATPSTQTTYANQTVYFSAFGASTGYVWSIPGSSGPTASTSWSTPGTYFVTVYARASTPYGLYAVSNTVTMTITVLQPQTQTITATPSSETVYVGQTASFTAMGGNTPYRWSTGSGGATLSTSWSSSGPQTVTVYAVASPSHGQYSASNVVSIPVTVLAAQSQSLIAAPASQTVYVGQTANFSAAGGTNYVWHGATAVGSGTTAYQTWTSLGPYSVSVSTTSAGSATLNVTVIAAPALAQTITGAPATQSLYINQNGVFSAAGSNTTYIWTNAVGSGDFTNAFQTWPNPGTYPVSVQAPAAGYYTASNVVNMTATVMGLPAQTITAAPATQTIYVGQSAYFSASGSSTGYHWSSSATPIGDGTGASESWTTPNTYQVTVYAPANSLFLQSNSVTLTVVVLPLQVQTITATPTRVNTFPLQSTTFSAFGAIAGYSWTPPIGNPNSASPNATGSWALTGKYTVKVQALGSAIALPSNLITIPVTVEPARPAGTNPSTNIGSPAATFLATKWHQLIAKIAGPIEIPTGAESFSRQLFSFSGARNWRFVLSYNSVLASAQTQQGLFGYGWSTPFEASIATSGSNLILNWDSTHNNTFTPVTGQTGTFSCAEEGAEYNLITTISGGGWTLKETDQSTRVFNASGQLIEDHDPQGRKLVLSYGTNGKPLSIVEPISSTRLTFAYDGSGRVTTLTDATGAAASFTYDPVASAVATILNQNLKQVAFTYDTSRELLTLVGDVGTTLTTNTYDSAGRAVSQLDGVAARAPIQLGYQQASIASNIVTAVTDKDGGLWNYTFDADYHLLAVTNPLSATSTFTYDLAGNRTAQTDALGNTTQFLYDGSGNVLSSTDPAGHTALYTYDGNNNLLKTTDPLGNLTTRTYDASNNLLTLTDALGRVTHWTYDANSLPLTETLPGGGIIHFTNTNGLPTQITDANGIVTGFTYDADGHMLSRTDSLGNQTLYTYDAAGNLLSQRDPLNQIVTRTYDYRNRLLTATDGTNATASYAYDNNNNLLSSTDPTGHVTAYTYDGEDRLLTVTDPLGHVSTRTYDAAGNNVSVTDARGAATRFTYDSANRLTAVTDPLGNATSYAYDVRGLLLSATDPLNRTYTFSYDALGRRIASTDPLAQATALAYDQLSRLTGVTDPGGLATGQAFDLDGNRLTTTDANGHVTSVTTDVGDRLTALTQASGGVTSYGYDARGLRQSVTKPSGLATSIAYDAAERVSSSTDSVGTRSFTRDADGRPLTTAENSLTLTRVYDAAGRLTQFADGAGNVLHYAYDAAGRLSTLTYPDGKTVTYGYDSANHLTQVTDWAARVTAYTYDLAGHLLATQRPNGTTQTRTYDPAGQLISLGDTGSLGAVIYANSYTYDADGRLVGEAPALSIPVAPTSQTLQTFNADNRLVTSAGQTASFDADGNLLTLPGATPASYAYDARNRLTAGGGISYAYDSEGRRTSLTDATGTTQFVINPNSALSQVLVRTAPNGTVTRYVYGLGLAYEETNSAAQYYHFDRRGDAVGLTNDAGSVVATISYGAYGEILAETGSVTTPFLFDGLHGVMTDGNGLYFHRSRYYNPSLRRFINQDPTLGDFTVAASLNRFAYANGAPISLVDPFGLAASDLLPDANELNSFDRAWNALNQPIDLGPTGNRIAYTFNPASWLASLGDFTNELIQQTADEADQNFAPGLGDGIRNLAPVVAIIASDGAVAPEVMGGEFTSAAAATADAAESSTTTLFRAVNPAEMEDALANGLQPGPNSFATGKWFATNASDATQWGNALEGPGNFQIMQAGFPSSTANQFMQLQRLDGIGPASFGTFEQINSGAAPVIKLWGGP